MAEVAAAAFALAGVIVGVMITSGYNFWSVRRQELVEGSVAVRALDEEMSWRSGRLSEVVSSRRAVALDVESALDVWREKRDALVLFTREADTYRELGAALRACESLEAAFGQSGIGELEQRALEGAAAALEELQRQRTVLTCLDAISGRSTRSSSS